MHDSIFDCDYYIIVCQIILYYVICDIICEINVKCRQVIEEQQQAATHSAKNVTGSAGYYLAGFMQSP